jgi:hypothetical protein
MERLLKPSEVAELLQISIASVYANARALGGIYPGGIKALRFNPEVIQAIMEGKHQATVRQQKENRKVVGGEGKGVGVGRSDAERAELIRFGLLSPDPGGPDAEARRKGSRRKKP